MSESIESARSRASIVEQILEQGQRLRNAMVKSILDNDPFYVDTDDSNLCKSQPPRHLPAYSNSTLNNSNVSSARKDFPNTQRYNWENLSSPSSPQPPPPPIAPHFDLFCHCKVCMACRSLPSQKPFHMEDSKARAYSNIQNIEDTVEVKALKNTRNGNLSKFAEREFADRMRVRPDSLSEEITKSIQNSYKSRAVEYFKYVDSLKITIHSLSLNQAGNRKVSVSSVDTKYKLPTSISHSYFIEYSVPELLINQQPKLHSKIDTGLNTNLFRICSKKLQNEEIHFKHTSVHDIVSLLQLNPQDVDIKFQVSSRTMRQKRANVLGYATFNMGAFEVTKHLTCSQDFPIVNEEFVLGTLKMTLQLGCGRMYFGKEFVEFVNSNRTASELLGSEAATSEVQTTAYNTLSSQRADSVIFVDNHISKENSSDEKMRAKVGNLQNKNLMKAAVKEQPPKLLEQGSQTDSLQSRPKRAFGSEMQKNEEIHSTTYTYRSDLLSAEDGSSKLHHVNTINDETKNKLLLYGLIYISEAQFFEGPINSYLSCQVFCQGDTLCSRVLYNSKEPVFNFYQKVPFLYDNSFLACMRDSSIVVDFWERLEDDDVAFGTSHLPLHQFFIAYRNKAIADTLLQNRLPVTTSDWWEPICSPVNGKICGQMKVLVAVGTAAQIHCLEVERGIKNDSQTVTYVPVVPEARPSNKSAASASNETNSFKRPQYLDKSSKNINQSVSKAPITVKSKANKNSLANNSSAANNKNINDKKNIITTRKQVDVGIQFDAEMDSNKAIEPTSNNKSDGNLLEAFLTQLIEQKQKNVYVENSTNTENLEAYNNYSKNLNNEKVGTSVSQSLSKLSQCKTATNTQLRKTADLLDYLNEALSVGDGRRQQTQAQREDVAADNKNNFKAHVVVEGALHLPCKRKCKSKKTRRKNVAYEEMLPSTYVTFETVAGADLKVTPVVMKSTSPRWDFRCDVYLPGEMLINSQKRFIFKVWRKNSENLQQPNLQTDVVLGFAALDLTVLLAGLPSLQGWFNIVDFSSKCNGQIKIHVTPLENISRFAEVKAAPASEVTGSNPAQRASTNKPSALQKPTLPVQEEPSELLSRALKRKFTELEEITQRLRSRLADVTKDDSDASNDEFADEFERDINTLCIESDFDMIDLGGDWSVPGHSSNGLLKEVGSSSNAQPVSNDSAYSSTYINAESTYQPHIMTTCSSSNSSSIVSQVAQGLTPGDQQLIAGKQRIDTLLEKLTLLSATDVENAFPSRYVSGCSINQDSGVTPSGNDTEKGVESSFNFDAILNSALFNNLCSTDANSIGTVTELDSSSEIQVTDSSSTNSLLTQFATYRQAPDGAGNSVDGSKQTV